MAHDLLERIEGCVQVSEASKFDGWWLSRLLDLIKVPRPRISAVAAEMTTGRELDYVYECLERPRAPHRAKADAERLARALQRGLETSPMIGGLLNRAAASARQGEGVTPR